MILMHDFNTPYIRVPGGVVGEELIVLDLCDKNMICWIRLKELREGAANSWYYEYVDIFDSRWNGENETRGR